MGKKAQSKQHRLSEKCVSIIIPLYNEEKTIVFLLRKLLMIMPKVNKEIIIINDGSTDKSFDIVKDYLLTLPENYNVNGNCTVAEIRENKTIFKLFSKENGGKGSAVKYGISKSSGEAVIIQDADLEYDVNDIEKCVMPILKNEEFVVYGSRETGDRERFSHLRFYLGGLAVTAFMNLLYGSELTDEPTCYKAFNGELIRNIKFKGNKFDWEPEVTAIIFKLGFKIKEVPINYYPRSLSDGKKIRWYDGLMAFWVTLIQLFCSERKHYRRLQKNCQNIELKKTASVFFSKMLCLLMIFNVSVGIRLFFFYKSLGNINLLFRPDSLGYLQPAMSLAKKLTYNTTIDSGVAETSRAIGFPFFMSFFFKFFNDNLAIIIASMVLILLSSLSVYLVYATARLFKCSRNWSLFAAALFGLNATSIASAPMMLSDTLHVFFATLLIYFFTRYYFAKNPLYAIISMFVCGIATLVRPVNLVWFIPAIFLILINNHHRFKIRILTAVTSVAVFFMVITPWMVRNYNNGSGFVIDDNYGNMLYHNGAALLAAAEGGDSGKIRADLIAKTKKYFLENPQKFKDNKKARYKYKTNELKNIVLKYPGTYAKLHFRPWILIPDVAGLLELQEKTTSGRGTFDVLNKSGFFAAVKHYLNGKYSLLLWIIPFLLITVITYLGCFLTLIKWIFKRKFFMIFYSLAFIEYYLILPGPVTMPRYILPALSVICVFAAIGYHDLFKFIKTKILKKS